MSNRSSNISADQFEYHVRRAAEERKRAEESTDPTVKRLHGELADRHKAMAKNHRPKLRIVTE